MAPNDRPAAEVDVDEALVRRLLAEQHPDLAHRPIRPLAEGWDNVLFRLGDDLTVRLPRRQVGADLVAHEHRFLATMAPRLPLPISAPTRLGRPTEGYPWHWSVCRWFEGTSAIGVRPASDAAPLLGAFLRALHAPAPADAPRNPYRGGRLAERDTITRDRIAQMASALDVTAVTAAWTSAVAAPEFEGSPCWLHGDLHPGNLVVDTGGHLVAVIDFGDLTSGDPACDLAVGWMWFDEADRARFFAAAGAPDEPTIARARGWALTIAIACLADSADAPEMAEVGRTTLSRVTGA